MSHAVGIDPGVRHLGFALADWAGEVQVIGCSSPAIGSGPGDIGAARLVSLAQAHAHAIPTTHAGAIVHLESMTATSARATTPQDLIDVQTVGCLTAGSLRPARVLLWTPEAWKGSVPKHVHHARILEALTGTEILIVQDCLRKIPAGHRKEALDALGLLLRGLGRIQRSGAPCRMI